MSALARSENHGLNLIGKTVAVAGGTQGIGAAVAIRFAQAGSSVYIIGRNATLGAAVIEQLKAASRVSTRGSAGKTFEFIQADLSLVSGINSAAQTLISKTGSSGIDYLIQTQGGPPNGKFALTTEGHEQHFAVQCLSRFGLPYLLAKAETLKETVVSICAPGGGGDTAPDIEDLDMIKAKEEGRYGLFASGKRDSAVVDGFTAEFASRFPSIRAVHLFPGYVNTDAVSNQGFPGPVVLLASLFGPILARTIGNTAITYAEIPVYFAANPKSRDGFKYDMANERMREVKKPKWVVEQPETRKALWEKLASMIQA